MQFSPFISRLIPMRTLAAFILVLLPLHMSQGAYASESPDAFGVLVMAHGGSPEWNRSVESAVEPLRSRCKIEIAFGMATLSRCRKACASWRRRARATSESCAFS